MRFWQMIDEGLVKIRQQRSGNPAGFPRNFPPFQLQMHGGSASSLQSLPRCWPYCPRGIIPQMWWSLFSHSPRASYNDVTLPTAVNATD